MQHLRIRAADDDLQSRPEFSRKHWITALSAHNSGSSLQTLQPTQSAAAKRRELVSILLPGSLSTLSSVRMLLEACLLLPAFCLSMVVKGTKRVVGGEPEATEKPSGTPSQQTPLLPVSSYAFSKPPPLVLPGSLEGAAPGSPRLQSFLGTAATVPHSPVLCLSHDNFPASRVRPSIPAYNPTLHRPRTPCACGKLWCVCDPSPVMRRKPGAISYAMPSSPTACILPFPSVSGLSGICQPASATGCPSEGTAILCPSPTPASLASSISCDFYSPVPSIGSGLCQTPADAAGAPASVVPAPTGPAPSTVPAPIADPSGTITPDLHALNMQLAIHAMLQGDMPLTFSRIL